VPLGPAVAGERLGDLPVDALDGGKAAGAACWWLWPSLRPELSRG
jgi:hypothetical protein